MKKARSKCRILSAIMTILILLVSLPTYAFATLIDDTSNTNDLIVSEDDTETSFSKSEVLVLQEDVSLREENIKHFKLSDGTTKAVAYATPVHYKDADGNWIDIDNALTLNGSEYTANNKSEIKFANKSGSSGLISIKDGEYKIDFTPLNTNKVSVEIENPQENNSRKFDDVKKLNNLVSYATYKNIYDGIDLEYVLVGNNIKENIIVNEKQESYEFSFEIKLSKLNATLENNAIVLTDSDTGEKVYEIPAPYMVDANGEYSDNVEYSLVQDSKWKYTITVKADPEWINSEKRAFPVKIDPTIGVESSVFSDAIEYSNTIYSSGVLKVGNDYKTQIMLSSLPLLPNDAYLTDATISLKRISGSGVYAGIYQYGTEDICDYNDVSAIIVTSTNEDDETIETEIYGKDGWYTWNVYDIVYNWYSDSGLIKCFEIKAVETTENMIEFESKETSASNRPIFEITYRDMKGVEPYWSYLTQSAGFAGTGAVNLATGNLMFEISTLTTMENIFGYTPSLIYNSAIAGESYKYGAVQNGYWYSFVAEGFKLNMNETLIKKSYINGSGDNAYYYVWADADGTEHYFLQSSKENEENIYYDEDGLQLKLVVDLVDDNEKTYCKIVDSGFNERIFYILGGAPASEGLAVYHLEQLKDKNGNILRFIMDGAHKPNDIKFTPSGTVQTTQLLGPLYNSSGKVALIWCNETKEGILFRHSDTPTSNELNPTGGTYLREALYLKCDSNISWANIINDFISDTDNQADGITVCASAKYEYDSQGKLITVYNTLSEYTLWYYYDEFGRIKEILEVGDESGEVTNGAGQNIQISYQPGYTEVRTSGSDDVFGNDDDLINVYVFDNQGRAVTTYTTNTDRNEIYGVSSGSYDDGENSKNSIKTQFSAGETSANYILNGSFENATPTKYWNVTSNVTAVNYVTYDKCETTRLKFNLQNGGEETAFQYVYLNSGKYTLSLNVRTDEAESVELTLSVGDKSEIIPIIFESNSSNDHFATFTFDLDVESYSSVLVKITAKSNTPSTEHIYIDNVMLAKSKSAVDYNLVTHGEFENTATNISGGITTATTNDGENWLTESGDSYVAIGTSQNTDAFIKSYGNGLFGNVLQINGDISDTKEVLQEIITRTNYDVNPYESSLYNQLVFKVSGYSYAPNAIANSSKSEYGIKVYYGYKEPSGNNEEIIKYESVFFPFNSNVNNWQYVTGAFAIPKDMKLSYVAVACVYSNNVGEAYFDNISVTKGEGNNLYYAEYYENGKIKYEEQGNNQSFYHYNSDGELADKFYNNRKVSYQYDSNHNVTEETNYVYFSSLELKDYNEITENATYSSRLSQTLYSYNEYGLLTSVETNEINEDNAVYEETDKIVTNYEYNTVINSKIFGALKSTTDSLGNTTRYFYNEKNGRLMAVIQPNNKGYVYSYDNLGQLLEVTPAVYNGTAYQEITDSASVEYVYNSNAQLEQINANGVSYYIEYDIFGNQESVSVGGYEIVSQKYNEYNGKVIETKYASATTVNYEYDSLERVSKVTYTKAGNSVVYTYEYHSSGNLSKITDSSTNTTTLYKYDANGALTGEINYASDTGEIKNFNYFKYNEKNQIKSVYNIANYLISNSVNDYYNMYLLYSYSYNNENLLKNIELLFLDGGAWYNISFDYDKLGRLEEKIETLDRSENGLTANIITNTMSYSYMQSEAQTSSVLISEYVSTVKQIDEILAISRYQYEYDSLGNITGVYSVFGNETTLVLQYKYDNLGRMIREDNAYTGKTYTYVYDNAGNILSENVYNVTFEASISETAITTNTYAYENEEWKDLLTSYNGTEIRYDNQGNQVLFGDMYFVWGETLNLKTIVKNGETLATYTYNESGIRTSKTVNGITHAYSLNGTLVTFESYGEIFIVYIYDENGSPIGMAIRDGATADITQSQEDQFSYYLFTKNLQGDITGIYDEEGNLVAEYIYNAWGEHTVTNHTSANIGNINPFRYRGYFYDNETGYYYLNTRYYNPQIKRFISADSVNYLGANGDLNSYNLYAYCSNNPVNLVDGEGRKAEWFNKLKNHMLMSTLVFTLVVGTNHVVNLINEKKIENEIEDSYTKEKAIAEIETIASKYGDDIDITFEDAAVKIKNSYKINSRYDRQKICMIITRSGVTDREYDNLSAEWFGHNVLSFIPNAKDVDLDYVKDPRNEVRFITNFLEMLGFE